LGSMNTQSIIIQRISPGDVSSNMNVFTSITPYLTGTGNNLLVAYGDSSFNGNLSTTNISVSGIVFQF